MNLLSPDSEAERANGGVVLYEPKKDIVEGDSMGHRSTKRRSKVKPCLGYEVWGNMFVHLYLLERQDRYKCCDRG